jgi:hypothetical protein
MTPTALLVLATAAFLATHFVASTPLRAAWKTRSDLKGKSYMLPIEKKALRRYAGYSMC